VPKILGKPNEAGPDRRPIPVIVKYKQVFLCLIIDPYIGQRLFERGTFLFWRRIHDVEPRNIQVRCSEIVDN
jgi:hypothetical protein